MSRVKPILVALVLALVASQARAEVRALLVQVKAVGDKAEVTVHSDEKKDRRTGATVSEAAKALAVAESWGSTVHVYVTADKGVREEDLKKVLAAIKGNYELTLEPVGVVPQNIREHFLKKEAK